MTTSDLTKSITASPKQKQRDGKPFEMPDDVALAFWRVVEDLIRKQKGRNGGAKK